ncbi:peptidylprolyl isomerase [Marinicella rhabdoformis]|uniref:peptidylprolyl isomerase n=1 Tax=Marinicella rhabdoformis TaxID=2580566 RepID=UPI0012AED305|nr:peptidylprolyl isomerase [Marinicella rhabdoformis]
MIKLIFFVISLLNQNTNLVEQNDVVVNLSDLDSYVHNLKPESRFGFAKDHGQIERNILSILNVNFVYQYVIDNDLDKEKEFASVTEALNTFEFKVDENFIKKLGIDRNDFLTNMKFFTLKKEYFMRMKIYIQKQLLKGPIQQYAYDQFLIEKNELTVPEKRRLSMITLDKNKHAQSSVVSLLTDVIKNNNFNEVALKISDDPTVQLNKGDLSYFSKKQFHYKFADDVFSLNETGIIPSVFEMKDYYYLISIDEILPAKEAVFEDHKQRLIDELLPEFGKMKLQNIINSYSVNDKIKIDSNVISKVFERYLVFEEDS